MSSYASIAVGDNGFKEHIIWDGEGSLPLRNLIRSIWTPRTPSYIDKKKKKQNCASRLKAAYHQVSDMKQIHQLYILVCYKGWKKFLKRTLGEKSLKIPLLQNSSSG